MVAVAVQHAQPSTGLQPDLAMHAKAFVQSLWLLTGLGNYVIYRVPPLSGDRLSQFVGLGILIGLFCIAVASTQTLSCRDCFDLLDLIYLPSNTNSAV